MISNTFSKLRRTLTLRKKRTRQTEPNSSTKPPEWLADEAKIKEGFCSFVVKYLGSIEVFESRGVQVCELAIKALNKKKKFRLFRKRGQRAILTVTGDELKVSDEISKHLLVDQTIEKVSFCAPDRFNPQGFAYICRDGATRRWMCHAFLAINDSGERLSHAVGCAFNICLEKKQKREKDVLQVTFNENKTSFTRNSSHRQTTLAERLLDPQMILNSSPKDSSAPLALEYHQNDKKTHINRSTSRPRPNPGIYQSTRLPKKMNEDSLLRRELSLRDNDINLLLKDHEENTEDLLAKINYSPSHGSFENPVITKKNLISHALTIPKIDELKKKPILDFQVSENNGKLIESPELCDSKDPFDLDWCEKIGNHQEVNEITAIPIKIPFQTPEIVAANVNNPFL